MSTSLSVAAALACLSACQPNPDRGVDPQPEPAQESWIHEELTPQAEDPRALLEARTPRPHAEYYAMPGLDHGLIQSPVNILSKQTIEGHHRVELHAGLGAEEVVNTGHTIELDFPRGTIVEFDGRSFELIQLHFHTPSEHQIDGVTYPMEMHIVNRLVREPESEQRTQPEDHAAGSEQAAHSEQQAEAGKQAEPEYLVFGLLFKMGEPSRFIAEFLDVAPPHGGEHAQVRGEPVNITELMDHITPYYHYNGSLTTPPYTESVTWVVAKEPLEASPGQIQKINQIEGNNARHVQATYGRVIDG